MWAAYFKIAFRQLLKDKFQTCILVGGLAIGMAACLLILQYVRYEWQYDKVSPHTPYLWRAFNQTVTDGQVTTQDGNTHSALAPSLKADLPEVTDYFRLYNGNENEVVVFRNNQPVKVPYSWMTDPGFLRLFPQRFLAGNPETCLRDPWKVILTESAAKRLFPVEEAMGKAITIPGGRFAGTYTVEAVVADPAQNTHLKFNILTGYATRYAKGHQDGWDSYWDYTYFELTPGADPEKIRQKLAAYSDAHLKQEGIRLAMQPFESIHLHSDLTYEIEPNGNARTVHFLSLAALFILAIAFINYVNMTTARSLERAKEVGLRKTVGARRGQLAGQFLLEGLLLNGIAVALALLVLQPLLPFFSGLVGRPLATQPVESGFVCSVIGLFLLGLTVSCGYPALVLTKFSPFEVLRGRAAFSKKSGNKSSWLRQGLVVFQFACSALLIFGLTVIGRQLHFLQNHDKGLSLDQIVAIKTASTDWQQDSIHRLKMNVLKDDLAHIAGIEARTVSSIAPGLGIGTIAGTSSGLVLADKPGEVLPGTIYYINAQPDFYNTYQIRFLAGAPYRAADERAGYRHVIINQAMCGLLGFRTPEAAIGRELAYPNSTEGQGMRIEGVVADFHIETLKEPTRPTLYYCTPDVYKGYISIKLESAKAQEVLAAVETSWKKLYPESPFEYWFLNEQFARQYEAETQLGKTFGLFSGLAILIACLGLLGLATHFAALRTKETGIRKVLGASVADITRLLTKDFLKPVFVGILCAAPVGYYLMSKWLQDFACRIEIEWWMFVATGALATGVAFVTVGAQSVQAALANPVKSLRNE